MTAPDQPYVTADDVKAYWDPVLNDADDADLEALVAEFEEGIEYLYDEAQVPRTATSTLTARWRGCSLTLPHRGITALTLTVNGTDVDATKVDVIPSQGLVASTDGWAAGSTVATAYTHGLENLPQRVRRGCLVYVRAKYLADRSDQPRDVFMEADPSSGMIRRYSSADLAAGRPFGIPDIDDLLVLHQQKAPLVG